MISVVTPCLNIVSEGREEFFRKMMGSVHNQSFKDTEHIVVDNGSTDGTMEILEEYRQKGWITVLAREEKRGIYPAMNHGIRLTKGDYINIMNTDDYFTDLNFLETAIKNIKKTGTDFIHADWVIKSKKDKPDSIKKGNEQQAFFRMPFRHQTMVVKKEIFDEIGLFDENYQVCADYKWVIKMLLANKKGYYLPQVVVCSLDGGASSNRPKCIEEVSKILFESYGEKYGLTLSDCKKIYERKFSLSLVFKIFFKVKNNKIKKSIFYGLFQELKSAG
ncbi:MAG: glycosyltransferase family 2 protein [Candidatus Paceibacterota bacterium]|jgi:glycosyltransferase involved in cell wall biosynthesis